MMRTTAALIMSACLLLMAGVNSHSQSKPNSPTKTSMALVSGWQFSEAGKDKWYPATVPGCIHTDLMKNKLIDDPFYRNNESKLQWRSEERRVGKECRCRRALNT